MSQAPGWYVDRPAGSSRRPPGFDYSHSTLIGIGEAVTLYGRLAVSAAAARAGGPEVDPGPGIRGPTSGACPAPTPGEASVVTISQLVRPRDGTWIAGVCAGLADRFGLSRGLVRLVFVSFGSVGAGELAYIILRILIPRA
jgi:phage shock protein C